MSTAEASGNATDALVERLFMASIDALELASVHVGGRLGFYRALAQHGPATSAELAEHRHGGARGSSSRRWPAC